MQAIHLLPNAFDKSDLVKPRGMERVIEHWCESLKNLVDCGPFQAMANRNFEGSTTS